MTEKKNAVVLKGLKKYFPGTKALDWSDDDVVEIKAGEIHGLIGENGAGKSTLFQILMGIYDMTGGEMELLGRPYKPQNVDDAEKAGVAIIMQQPNFAWNLTVAENIFLGQDKRFLKGGVIDWKKQNSEAAEVLSRFGFDHIKPTDVMQTLGYEEKKQVEIARALSHDPKVLLVDETSAAISQSSVDILFSLLRKRRDEGCAVIYISHFIDEVYELCDRVSILRDGKLVAKMEMDESVTPEKIIQNMVGRDMSGVVYRSEDQSSIGDVMLETRKFSREGEFEEIDLNVRSGEIVGIAGLGGCGSESFGRTLFGYDRPTGGELWLEGEKINVKSPLVAMKKGIGYIPKDRDREGLFLIYDSVLNISAANMMDVSKSSIIDHKKEREIAVEAVRKFLIKTPSELTPVSDLSGGNRQKVVISKWVVNNTRVLVVNSPTRGVDVGAKYEIYKILEDLKNQGKAILLISDELPELIGMSDRVYCFRNGKISGEFQRTDFSEKALATKMV